MSAALVRQALEFVDPDESSDKRKKRGGAKLKSSPGQGQINVQKKNKKSRKNNLKEKNNSKSENDKVITKLLQLSKPSLDQKTANKIVKRAVTGKPVADKVKVKKEKQKSILFPDEDFKQFEKQPFCN